MLAGEHAARIEAEWAEQRSAFLAEASRVLATSLDYEATLASVVRLAVPQIADCCLVYTFDEDRVLHRIGTAHADPAKEAAAPGLRRSPTECRSRNIPAAKVLRAGEPDLGPELLDSLLEAVSEDTGCLRFLREVGSRSTMVVPLLVRGRLIGAMGFLASEEAPGYGPADLVLAEDLAGRAALAVDNARLYRERPAISSARTGWRHWSGRAWGSMLPAS